MPVAVKTLARKPKSPYAPGEVRGLFASDDASLVVIARRNPALTVYDVASGKVLLEHDGALSFLPGRRALVGQPQKPVHIVELDGGEKQPLGSAKHWAKAASAHDAWNIGDETLTVWDLDVRKARGTLPLPPTRGAVPGAHAPSFFATEALPERRMLAWLDARFCLHLFDLAGCRPVAAIKAGLKEIPALFERSRDGRRALAIGSKGTAVVFDLEENAVASKKEKLLPGTITMHAWLDDGRLVLPSRLLEVIDLTTGKRRELGKLDPSYEKIHALVPLEGPRVLVLVSRITDPKMKILTTRFFEIWDVDRGKQVGASEAEEARAPLHRAPDGTIFAIQLADDVVMKSTWRAYRLS